MACLGGTVLAVLLQSCAGQYYATSAIEGSNLKISLKEFTEDKKAQPIDRKYVLVKSEKLNFPIYLFKVNERQYSALWMECSHQGSELSAHGEYLTCPSHGSEFDKFGNVTSGPASKNLRSFKTTVDTQFIYIQLS